MFLLLMRLYRQEIFQIISTTIRTPIKLLSCDINLNGVGGFVCNICFCYFEMIMLTPTDEVRDWSKKWSNCFFDQLQTTLLT